MPLTEKGEKIKANMEEQYGPEKGERVFYASKNKGTIKGVDGDDAWGPEARAAALKARQTGNYKYPKGQEYPAKSLEKRSSPEEIEKLKRSIALNKQKRGDDGEEALRQAEADMGPGHIARHVGYDALYHGAVGKGLAPDPGGSDLDQPKKGSTEPLGVGDEGQGDAPLRQLEAQIEDERRGQLLMGECDRLEKRLADCQPKLDAWRQQQEAARQAEQDAAEQQAALLAGNAASAQLRAERAGVKLSRFDQVNAGAMPVQPPSNVRSEAAISGGRGGNIVAR